MSACLDEVALWMRSNRLQLNTAKTEVLWCATSRRQYQIPLALVWVGEDLITPAASIGDLGIYLDSDTSRSHVSKTVLHCFAALRRINSIRFCVPRRAVLSLVVSLVLSRLDYGSATLVGLPALPDRSAAVRVERRRPAGLLIAEVRPRDASSSLAALAEDESADRLQTGSSRLPLPQRPGSVVPRQRPPVCGGPQRVFTRHQRTHSSCL